MMDAVTAITEHAAFTAQLADLYREESFLIQQSLDLKLAAWTATSATDMNVTARRAQSEMATVSIDKQIVECRGEIRATEAQLTHTEWVLRFHRHLKG